MSSTRKLHAKDYLLEYERGDDISNWMKLLIQKVIDTDAKISDEDRSKIFQELLKENGINTQQDSGKLISESVIDKEEVKSSPTEKLVLQKITHVKGVNALIQNQSITLSPTCTVIYGLNSSGKSGYFRIINELAGGSKPKQILDNIYRQDKDSQNERLEVKVNYFLNDEVQPTVAWKDKSKRGIFPFNQIKVFDLEYSPIFLGKHKSSVNKELFGLHFFQVIVKIIDEFKDDLKQMHSKKLEEIPNLQTLIDRIHSEVLKRILCKENLSTEEKKKLDENKIFSEDDEEKLRALKKCKADLERTDTKDRKKVLEKEKEEIDKLKKHLLNLQTNLNKLTKNISSVIEEYLKKKNIRDNRVKEFEVLKNIPSQDSEEWQSFIESARLYGSVIESSNLNNEEKCIYCHQPLSMEALKIVKTYATYLNDQSQQDFKAVEKEIFQLKQDIENLITDPSLPKDIKEILNDITIKNESKSCKMLLDQVIKESEEKKTSLKKAIESKTEVSEKFNLSLFSIDEELQTLSKKKQNELGDLQKSSSEKSQKIERLKKEINNLEDKENISKKKIDIEKYFSTYKCIQKYNTVKESISTTKITNLSIKAHNELLTESVRQFFEKKLKALDQDIEVSLENAGGEKGAVHTNLKIHGNDVRAILSDGEQKAVSFALFLAEIESQNNNCPIVFDDPVTSIDHEIADCLAKELLHLSLNRQIIIFTHNKLFYDSLIY